MSEVLSVKVDVLGQMANNRKAFARKCAFVSELFQNAQRSHASRIEFSYDYKNNFDDRKGHEIVVTDDGVGCDDFNFIFTQAISGWDDETKKAENPFGAGFFSTMVVADEVIVRSHGKEARFDVAKMFSEKRTDVVTVGQCEFHKGFQVILRKLMNISEWDLKNTVYEIGKYIPLNTVYCGMLVSKVSFTEPTDQERTDFGNTLVSIDSSWGKGVVWLSRYGYVQTYLNGRPVEHIQDIGGLTGRFAPTGLTPRSPDRDAWIQNKAYYRFWKNMKGVLQALLLKVVESGDRNRINQFNSLIGSTLKVKDVKKHITFKVLTGGLESDSEDLSGGKIKGISYDTLRARKRAFWVKSDDSLEKIALMREATYFGVDVILSDNDLQSGILENASNCVPLDEIKHELGLRAERKFAELTKEEKRAQWLLRQAVKVCGLRPELLCVDDAEVEVYISGSLVGDSSCRRRARLKDSVSMVASLGGGSITVLRKSLLTSMLVGHSDVEDAPIGDAERAFLARTAPSLAHELSHALLNAHDGDVALYKGQEKMLQMILAWLFPAK